MARKRKQREVSRPSVKQVTNLFARAKERRTPREARFDQAMRYTMPGRGSFFGQTDLDNQVDDVFDETAIVAVQEFASRFQAAMTPNHSRWAELEAGTEVKDDERDEVNKALDAVTEAVFEVIHNSNFSQESFEAFLDMSVSMGAMEVIEGDALNPIIHNAIPLSQLWVLGGPYDMLDKFFRVRNMTADDLRVRYPQHRLPPEKMKELEELGKPAPFLEAVIRDWSEPAVERHHKFVIYGGEIEVWHQVYEGVGSCPIIGFRWAKAAGEDWGRGPTLNALPAIKTCNLVVQMILENAQMAIAGIYNADDDVVNPDTIELLPGTIVPRSPGSRGLEPVGPAGNFNVAELVLGDMRANIKRALYNDMLGNPDKTPMSATEVAERMADLSRQIGSAFGRVWSEFCTPYLQRVVYILKKRGLIELPSVNGRTVKVTAKSPLAQAQAQIDIQNSDRLVELVNARFGPQLANVFIKGEAMSKYWADKLQVPGDLVRTEPEMAQLAQQIAQMSAAAEAPQAAPMTESGVPAIG
jgi:hypothetical protein